MNEWISVNNALPQDGQKVLIYAGDISVATFKRGISWEDREKMMRGEIENPVMEVIGPKNTPLLKRSQVFYKEDVFNGSGNTVPYFWYTSNDNFYPRGYNGQDVTHWMQLPEPPQ